MGNDLIEKLIEKNDQLLRTNSNRNDTVNLQDWLRHVVNEGISNLSKLIDEQIEDIKYL